MATKTAGVVVRNGQAVSLRAVPVLHMAELQDTVLSAVERGERIVSYFGSPLGGAGGTKLFVVLADDGRHTLSVLASEARGSFPSLTPRCPQAHLFEREVCEQTGLAPNGHPWLKPVRAHDLAGQDGEPHYRYFSMRGEEAHEVAVGPVHAGVIEPGHFRFQCHGETVEHLEVHLGYQHRGVEEALVGGPHQRTVFQMETVAGDTTVGHTTAYALALEALGGVEAPPRAQAIRAIALELERLANHVGDMGALAGDVAFLPTASFCGGLRGDFLNMTALVCGSRFGRGLVRPGGVAFDLDGAIVKTLLERLDWAERHVRSAVDLFIRSDSSLARMDGVCAVSKQACLDLGFVGMAARACGVPRDARTDHPFGWHRKAAPEPATWPAGDVLARAMVRKLEIDRSIAYVRSQLLALPGGQVRTPCPPPAPESMAVALVEGWRGEVAHVALTDAQGRLARYKITDPSFHNWTALALALRGQQISDFPLCNKSFNLSYCGFDL